MSARVIGTATISFGLVSVPVKLYSSGESSASIGFNLVHKKCGTRLKQQYICPKDGDKVERADMVKGYEFTKGSYVLFTPEELKAIEAKSAQAIDIKEFVPAQEVERALLEKVYYLGPDKGGDRAYKLLSAALKKTGRSAVGRFATRGKEYLVMIRPMGDGLVLEQLRFADEMKPFSEVPLGDAEVKDDELQLAVQLIEQAATDEFDHERHEDTVRAKILEMIQAKVEGADITVTEAEEPKGQIIDLMSALKASLAASKSGGASGPKAATRTVADSPAKQKVSGDAAS
jgi:DNA end-binding protein Ku